MKLLEENGDESKILKNEKKKRRIQYQNAFDYMSEDTTNYLTLKYMELNKIEGGKKDFPNQ